MVQKINLLVLILILSFLVRIPRFDFPFSYTFAWGDGTRDFLVANHILKFQEFPLIGPYNLLNDSGIYNSPIYFYVLSLLLAPFNNILFLSFLNILLQLGVIALIYIICKRLFDYPTAIISILLFSFNPEIIKQADFVWQPHLMLPAALLALYFFIKSRYIFALISISVAACLHNAAFPWLLAFSLLVKVPFKKKLAVTILTLTILYLPVLLYYFQSGKSIHFSNASLSFTNYLINFAQNINQLLGAFYLNNMIGVLLGVGFIIVLKKSQKKKELLLLLLLFILPLILISFFNKLRLHYIILSMAILPILVAKITDIFKPDLRYLVVFLLLVVLSNNFSYLLDKKPLENQVFVNGLTLKVTDELVKIKKDEGFDDFDFFQIVSLMRTDSKIEKVIPYPVLDTFLLIGLEEKLSRKLAAVSDLSPYNHIQTNDKKYLIISCFKSNENETECLDYFKTKYPDFNILKKVYNGASISIYLAKNEQI